MSAMDCFCHRTGIYPIELPTDLEVGPVNVFLCKHDVLTLVDAGINTDQAWAALEHGLDHWGVGVRDLERIILTHHHIDHVGLVERMLDVKDMEVCAHPDTLLHLENDYTFNDTRLQVLRDFYASFGVPDEVFAKYAPTWEKYCRISVHFPVNRALTELTPVGRFMPLFVPGHAPTDTLLLDTGTGAVLSGDHILQHVNPNPILRNPLPGRNRAKSLVEYQTSLAKTRGLDLTVSLPGHGAPFLRHRSVIDGILAAHSRRREQIRQLVPQEGITPYAVMHKLYHHRPATELRLCLSVACGHLEALEEENILSSAAVDGVSHYYVR